MSPDCPEPIIHATLAAVHRRDHIHDDGDCCRPHTIEVIRLGQSAMAICHDCGFSYGFERAHTCEEAASLHRMATA